MASATPSLPQHDLCPGDRARQLGRALDAAQAEAALSGTSELSASEIELEIKAARKARRAAKSRA